MLIFILAEKTARVPASEERRDLKLNMAENTSEIKMPGMNSHCNKLIHEYAAPLSDVVTACSSEIDSLYCTTERSSVLRKAALYSHGP